MKTTPSFGRECRSCSRGGGAEIRTLAGCDPAAGFQDQSLQPLGYASVLGYSTLIPFLGEGLTFSFQSVIELQKHRIMVIADVDAGGSQDRMQAIIEGVAVEIKAFCGL